MAPAHSKPLTQAEIHARQNAVINKPSIPFVNSDSAKKKKKNKEDDEDETAYVTFELKLNPDATGDNEDTFKTKVPKFGKKENEPEEWCAYRMELQEVMDHKKCSKKFDVDDAVANANALVRNNLLVATLAGQIRKDYMRIMRTKVTANDAKPDGEKETYHALQTAADDDVRRMIFKNPGKAYENQVTYMKHNLHIGNMTVQDFYLRLNMLNQYLWYFPASESATVVKALSKRTIITILDQAKKPAWAAEMTKQSKSAGDYVLPSDFVDYLEKLERAEEITSAQKEVNTEAKKAASGTKDGKKAATKKPSESARGKCPHCGKTHANHDGCWSLPKNKHLRPDGWKDNRTRRNETSNALKEADEAADLFMALLSGKNGKKRTAKSKKKERGRKRSRNKADAFMAAIRRKMDEQQANASDDDSVESGASDASCKCTSKEPREQTKETRPNLCFATQNKNKRKRESSSSASREIKNEVANPFFSDYRRPASKKQKDKHYSAEIIVEIEDRDGNVVPIRGLLDTGTSSTIVLRQFVRKGRAKSYKGERTEWSTLGGKFSTNRKALIDFKFPELSSRKTVTHICHVDDKTDPEKAMYDIIIGLDLMTAIGIYVNTEIPAIVWEDSTIPLKERGQLEDREVMEMIYNIEKDPDILKQAEERHSRILDADYSKVDVEGYVNELDQLNDKEKLLLIKTLSQFDELFSGGLGTLNVKPVHLELVEGAKPYHSKPFPIPKSLERTTKVEMERLTDIDVFEKNHDSEWAAPTFVQPKKTGDVRILTDFRRLNAVIKRKPFPLPKISDILQKLSGFKWATAIDLSMGYYHIPLDEESQKLCTTILPWGKYRYKRLPMGIKNSPDVFQSIMTEILGDLEYTRTYIDDVLITSNGSFEDHCEKVAEVLSRLQKAGFRANLRKCFFGRDSLEYLGYWLTRNGVQPQPKKVEAIIRLNVPKTKRQLRHFLGMVNYYRDMWRRRSHILAPLTSLISKDVPFKWTQEHTEAFEEMKAVIGKETMLTFPDFNKKFHIYTDASNTQLGAVIMQEGKPLAFYSRKMNSAQRRYTTGEQELLSIVETLKEFRNILLGQDLVVHTDHMNIIYGNLSNDRIARWRLLLEEFGPEYQHIKGKDNVVADALSRLDADFETVEVEHGSDLHGKELAMAISNVVRDESEEMPEQLESLAKKMISPREIEEEKFPLFPPLIQKEQRKDKKLQKELKKKPEKYGTVVLEEAKLVTYDKRIVVPRTLTSRVVDWYHVYLSHPGETRMIETLSQTLYWSGMHKQIHDHVKTCDICQRVKGPRKKYGLLPKKIHPDLVPWNRVDVDLIGPFTVTTPKGKFELRALTMIDPATGWFEIKDISSPSAQETMEAFDDTWLSRYPRPEYLGFDGGSEYKQVFKDMRTNYGMKPCQSTSYNPQANGTIERVHQVLNNCLLTFELEGQDLDEKDPWRPFLAAAAFAIRSTFHTTLKASPSQLVFQRDMLLPIKFTADWARIREQKQKETDKNNKNENRSRIPHEYSEGDLVLLTDSRKRSKLTAKRTGPYEIVRVNSNGTVRIRKGQVLDTVNIRRVTPYFERSHH